MCRFEACVIPTDKVTDRLDDMEIKTGDSIVLLYIIIMSLPVTAALDRGTRRERNWNWN